TVSSVRKPRHRDVIWKKKGSSNTCNVGLSAVSVSNLNKNVKRYSRKDLLACNNSHLGETRSNFVCNDAMHISCDSKINDLLDDNNFFIFDDVNVRISPVSKMPFRKKPRDSMQMHSKSNMIKSLPRTMHKWLPKLQPLAEPVAKWFPRVERQIDKISKIPNSPGPIYKWVPKSSENVISESENQSENDCHVIVKECDKEENPNVIAPGMFKLSMSQSVSPISISKTSCDSKNVEIKLKRKRHTFSSVRRPKHSGVIWKKKGSSNTFNGDLYYVSQLKENKDVKRYSRKDLLSCNNSHLGESRNAFVCNNVVNVSCNSRMCDLLDDNNLFIFDDESVKMSHVSKMPFRKKSCDSMNIVQICLWIIDSGCSKHITGNRALLTNFVEKFLETVRFGNNDFAVIAGYGDVDVGKLKAKGDIGVFVGYSKESVAFRIYNKGTCKIHESVNVNFDELSEMASKQFSLEPDLFQDFYDEYVDSSNIMKSSTTNVETLINEEVFHEVSESFQGESSSSSLYDDVQQSPEEVILPQTNTQSISINMVPNRDEASTSGNVFNERLEDAYFDATLRDADWVSAMQEELDQFARLKFWRLVPLPEGKTVIKTKWIFKNKKDESSLVIQNKERLVA
nr:retrovirus-related Pol polyprotein from transposon TNT 1-94 [Tanacetum cinerariifolium]